MKNKTLKKSIYLIVVIYIISLLTGFFIATNKQIPLSDMEILAEVSGNDSYYMMIAGSNETSIVEVNEQGRIINANKMAVSQGFDDCIVEYEGSVFEKEGTRLFCVRRWVRSESMRPIRREIVELDTDKLSAKPVVIYAYESELLPTITNLTYLDNNLYVSMISNDNEKAYVDKIDLITEDQESKVQRIKSINSPIGDQFSKVMFSEDYCMYALTKFSRIYECHDNSMYLKMIYPSSVAEKEVITLMSLKQGKGLQFFNRDKNMLFLYENGVLGEQNLNDNSAYKSLFGNKDWDVLFLKDEGKDGVLTLITSREASNDRIQLICSNDGNVVDVENINYGNMMILKESLSISMKYFLISIFIVAALYFVIYVIRKGKKIIYKFILVIIPILTAAFVVLGYTQNKSTATVISDLKCANAMSVNNTIVTSIDKGLVRNLRDNSDSYWDGTYGKLYDDINTVLSNNKHGVKDISDDVFVNSKVAGVDNHYIYNELFLVKDGRVYTGISDKIGYMIPVGIEFYEGTEQIFDDVLKTGIPQIGSIASRVYRGGVYVSPVYDDGEIIGLLSTTYDVYTISNFILQNTKMYTLVGLCLIIGVAIPIYLMFKIVLKPLKELGDAVNELSKGNYSIRMDDTSSDEFSYIRGVFNKMCEQLTGSIYRVNNISQSYFRFVPRHIFSILDKKDILDVSLGDKRNMSCTLGMHILHNFDEIESKMMSVGGDTLSDVMNFVNRYFGIVYSSLKRVGGELISNDLKLKQIDTIFENNSKAAVEYAIDIMKKLYADEKLNEITNLDMSMIIYKTNILYGIAGEEKRAFPFMLSTDSEQLDNVLLDFKSSGARVIITKQIKDELVEFEDLDVRYIGYSTIDNGETRIDMYEVLNCCDLASQQQKQSTNTMFQNALELFYKGEFYLARNEFANIVKKSPLDNIARWYVFASDKYCNEHISNANHELYGDKSISIN